MSDWEHDQYLDRQRLAQQMRESDDAYEQERIDTNRDLIGLVVGIVLTLAIAFGIYYTIKWYINTMPHSTFQGLKRDTR